MDLGLVQLVTHLSHVVVSRSSTSFHWCTSLSLEEVALDFFYRSKSHPGFKAHLVYLLQLILSVPPLSPKGSWDKPPPARPLKVNAVRRLKDGKGFSWSQSQARSSTLYTATSKKYKQNEDNMDNMCFIFYLWIFNVNQKLPLVQDCLAFKPPPFLHMGPVKCH